MKFLDSLRCNISKITEPWIQDLVLLFVILSFFLSPFYGIGLTIYILFYTEYWPFMILYIIWIYVDRQTCNKNGRRINWLRKSSVWKHFRNYFPQKLWKTAELESNKNYIFALFPHGLIFSTAFSHLASESSEFYSLYPGLKLTGHTLKFIFFIPFAREYAFAIGMLSVSKEALLYQLNQEKGKAVAVIIGGSREAMITTPGIDNIILKNRKGFVKLALETGTSLVPIYVFGENDIYDQLKFPWLTHLQEFIRSICGFAPCIPKGRFILPKKIPVNAVIGKPIPATKIINPTQQEIDHLHEIFKRELILLYETHKYKFLDNPSSKHLTII